MASSHSAEEGEERSSRYVALDRVALLVSDDTWVSRPPSFHGLTFVPRDDTLPSAKDPWTPLSLNAPPGNEANAAASRDGENQYDNGTYLALNKTTKTTASPSLEAINGSAAFSNESATVDSDAEDEDVKRGVEAASMEYQRIRTRRELGRWKRETRVISEKTRNKAQKKPDT